MRTFKLTLGMDFKAVVPNSVTAAWRADALSDEATPFLYAANERFKDDDEGFTLHILKHGCRSMVRQSLVQLLESTGIGGTIAPASIKPVDISEDMLPELAQPVLASEIEAALQGTLPTEQLG